LYSAKADRSLIEEIAFPMVTRNACAMSATGRLIALDWGRPGAKLNYFND
jgi:hypothetical protein